MVSYKVESTQATSQQSNDLALNMNNSVQNCGNVINHTMANRTNSTLSDFKSDRKSSMDNTYTSELSLYKNQAYRFQICIPSDWKIMTGKNIVYFYSPSESDMTPSFHENLIINISLPTDSLDQLVSRQINNYYQTLKGFKIVYSRIDQSANKYWVAYTYQNDTYKNGLHPFEAVQYGTINTREKVFSIKYTAEQGQFSKHLLQINEILQSFTSLESDIAEPSSSDNLDQQGIKIDHGPFYISANPDTGMLYVGNLFSKTVSVIDSSTDTSVADIVVPSFTTGISVNRFTNMIYVASDVVNKVYAINGSTNKVTNIIDVGHRPIDVATDEFEGSNMSLVFVTNSESNNVSVINGSINKKVHDIPVGSQPVAIAINPFTNTLYVANFGSDSVSVINYFINSMGKINATEARTIRTGLGNGPNALSINLNTSMLYVTNADSDSVSVVNTTTNAVIKNVTVQIFPQDVRVNPNTNRIYVTNSDSNTVSVINGSTNDVNDIIYVGRFPYTMYVDPDTDIIYVTNRGSRTVSVIDGSTDTLMTGVTLDVRPSNGGSITCNNNTIPTSTYERIPFGTLCVAEPSPGFRFSSWVENLGHNSSKTLKVSTVSGFPFSLLRAGGISWWKDTSAILPISQYGKSFIANFERDPLIPNEYIISIFGILGGVAIGTGLPSMIRSFKGWRQRKHLSCYIEKIEKIYDEYKGCHVNKEKYLNELDEVLNDIMRQFKEDRITEPHYNMLKDMLELYKNKE